MFCSLIVASKFHPTPLLLSLLEFVAPSRPFVVYCQYKEVNQVCYFSCYSSSLRLFACITYYLGFFKPLLECYAKLRERGGVINLKLSETWLRNYQVRIAVSNCQSCVNTGEQNTLKNVWFGLNETMCELVLSYLTAVGKYSEEL